MLSPSAYFRHNLLILISWRSDARMHAYVYKSQRKQDTYLYLAKREDFAVLPEAMQTRLAPFAFVLELTLTPPRHLARADVGQVRAQLAERGFYLQFPLTPVPAGACGDG